MKDLKVDVVTTEETNKIKQLITKAWDSFHKFGLWITLFLMCGVWIGVSASKTYYTEKMKEVIHVGAMAFEQKVYIITPK